MQLMKQVEQLRREKIHIRWLKLTKLLHTIGGKFKLTVSVLLLLCILGNSCCQAFDLTSLLDQDASETIQCLSRMADPQFYCTEKRPKELELKLYENFNKWRLQYDPSKMQKNCRNKALDVDTSEVLQCLPREDNPQFCCMEEAPEKLKFEFYEDFNDWELQDQVSKKQEKHKLLDIKRIKQLKNNGIYMLDGFEEYWVLRRQYKVKRGSYLNTIVNLSDMEKLVINLARNLFYEHRGRTESAISLTSDVTLGRLVLIAEYVDRLDIFKQQLKTFFKQIPSCLKEIQNETLEVLCKRILDKNFYY